MNVEADLVRYLGAKLGVPAYKRVPAERPASFATVERTGGSVEPHRQLPSVTVDVWAPTDYEASELAARCCKALVAYESEPGVYAVHVGTVYSIAPDAGGQSRYGINADLITEPID